MMEDNLGQIIDLPEVELAGKTYPSLKIQSQFIIDSSTQPNTRITRYEGHKPIITSDEGGINEIQVGDAAAHLLKLDLEAPNKLGLMLVGWGGNNGSTLTASLLAHQQDLKWEDRRGTQNPSFLGSLLMASCAPLAQKKSVPLFQLAPFVHPRNIVINGWDLSKINMFEAMNRAQVLMPTLKEQLRKEMSQMVPLPSYYDPSFIASNQRTRADNLMAAKNKREVVDLICQDIQRMKKSVDKVVILWTANTERLTEINPRVHMKGEDLLKAIDQDHSEISPSTLFAVACILEGVLFINGSPQNTLIPAVVDLAMQRNVPIAGDDFKSGQTKLKSVLTDFLVSSGIKPLSIVSYNHLGNNDGKNLAEAAQFRSKELSKSSVCDDILAGNSIMFPGISKEGHECKGGIDHKIVIEYVPAVGDTKRAMDEYECEIFMGGRQTFSIYTVCEDSLLAAPLMLDLVLMGELLTRVQICQLGVGASPDMTMEEVNDNCSNTNSPKKKVKFADHHSRHPWKSFNGCLSLLSFMLKAPQVPPTKPIINALNKQRRAIETFLKALCGLPPLDDLDLESRF